MQKEELIKVYKADSLIQSIATELEGKQKLQIKGLVGSLDALIPSIIYKQQKEKYPKRSFTALFILPDREEASYFCNDLQNLLDTKVVRFFPISYKRPYHFEEVENANVLQRSEVLNQVHQKNQDTLIVTYPEALSEKVVNQKSLHQNTFWAKVGENIDLAFLQEILYTYAFEKVDFVYEAGQYALRGGILDVYSFSNDLPHRIELFGDEIESIRLFDPESQLSVEQIQEFPIIPNLQTQFTQEVRESFLTFLPKNTQIWIKDFQDALEILEQSFQKVEESFEQILEQSGNTQVISNPELLFTTKTNFKKEIFEKTSIEFGKRFVFDAAKVFEYQASPQPSFNKNFHLLADNLQQHQIKYFTNIITAESFKQTERLTTILEELNPKLEFETINIGFREGFIDKNLRLLCYTDHQVFERFFRYKTQDRYQKSKALTLKELSTLQPGDYVTHIEYGVGRFAGLEKTEINGREQEIIRIIYRDNDLLYINIHSLHKIAKYSGKESTPPTMSKLGSGEWEAKKKKVKKRVQELSKDLIELYAKRKTAPGFAFKKDDYMQAELESSFIYEDTPDQARATQEVKEDMEQANPMDRLICGDVGFGKTEVAIRAAFKAVNESKQVAILVPTTVLAAQHFRSFQQRLADLPCEVDYINRFKSSTQTKETLKKVSEGKIDILIGTHKIVGKDVKFKDLGLLIIDEEQKFGVKTKDKLKKMRVNVDVLTLTATPIPRTLHFSLMGARDLSIIATPPPNRQPVTTELHTFNDIIIRDAISFELQRGGQVFFVHNRVNDIESIANLILKLVPDARIGIAHGQMEGRKLEKAMMKFIEGDYDILVSTNIIESGLDIPNANTIIINMAHTFGLSDLHQMRGRVGRSNRKAFCYLLTPTRSLLTSDARKRLTALEEFSGLGDGFKVAMRDLDIRGAGNLLGSEQTGFISDLGFETYHKILDEAIQELKETEFKNLFEKENTLKEIKVECTIETDLQILIPDAYVQNIAERIELYSQLDNLKDENSLVLFKESLIDRFGKTPQEVEDLFQTVYLRWKAEEIGFEKLTIKNNTLKGYFISNNEEYFKSKKFEKVLHFLQKNPQKAQLKEVKQKPIIIFRNITSIQEALEILTSIN